MASTPSSNSSNDGIKYIAAAAVGAASALVMYKFFNEREHQLQRRLTRIHKREQKGEFAPERKPIRIWVDGCFDLMHFGHANAFRQARALGDVLVVGLNTDEEIRKHKGPPIMSEEERFEAVSACKWVDEVVRDVPYVMNEEYLNFIFDKYKIDYVVHGDDPCLLADGTDVFATAKKAGRFKTVKRTEGVSTTEIVGRMLLMTKSHFRRGSEADRPRLQHDSSSSHSPSSSPSSTAVAPLQRSSAFLPTARRINQFSSGRTPKPADKVVYIDGAWDMFHAGHIDILRKAKALGNFLLVGVHTDEAVNSVRGAHTNYPILNLHERVLSVLSCKYVDEVIIGAPYKLTEDMVRSMNISVVAHGSISDSNIKARRADPSTNPYAVGEALGICVELESSRNLTTMMIVERIMQQRLDFETKFKKKNAKEQEYLATAGFVEEQDNAVVPAKRTPAAPSS